MKQFNGSGYGCFFSVYSLYSHLRFSKLVCERCKICGDTEVGRACFFLYPHYIAICVFQNLCVKDVKSVGIRKWVGHVFFYTHTI